MTVRVYDPNNQMFEVSDARAAELVLNHGWTRQPTTTVPVETAPPAEPEIDDWRLGVASEYVADEDYEPEPDEIAAMEEYATPEAEAERAAAERGEPAATEALARYCEQLARALASVINILDPQVIVLGGGLSNIPALYREVPPLLVRHVFSDQVNTRLVQARHGDSSGVRGAAWLWPE